MKIYLNLTTPSRAANYKPFLVLFSAYISLILFSTSLNAQSFRWVMQAGGTGKDRGRGIGFDPQGNYYWFGDFTGKASFGNTNLTTTAPQATFLAKLDRNATSIWIQQMSGIGGTCIANGLCVDGIGNAYVTGPFLGSLKVGGVNLTTSTVASYAAKIDATGRVVWVNRLPDYFETGRVGTDAVGNVYLAGSCTGTGNFPGVTFSRFSAVNDWFIVKYGSDGTFQWVRRAGGINVGEIGSQSMGVSVDSFGNSFVVASLQGEVMFGDTPPMQVQGTNTFVAKHDPQGNLSWVRQITGGVIGSTSNAPSGEHGCAVDTSGNVYALAGFHGIASFGAVSLTNNIGYGLLLAKYDTDGNFLWAWSANGTNIIGARNLAVDATGSAYVTGQYIGETAFGNTTLTHTGNGDIFVAKYDAAGNLLWVVNAGGIGVDAGWAIAVDACGNPFITGAFSDTAVFGTTVLTSNGGSDIFLARLDAERPELGVSLIGGQAIVSWPVSSSGCFQLESSTNLAVADSWTALETMTAQIDNLKVVTNRLLPTPQFYRLRNP